MDEDGRHECTICPIRCKLQIGQLGACGARIGRAEGVGLAGMRLSSAAVEPIEKKPIFHYKPNLRTLSIGGFGCNMACDFCQNYMVSQTELVGSNEEHSPQEIIKTAISKGCGAICFTYSEPIVYYEYLMELRDALPEPLELVLKTNGYAEPSAWGNLCRAARAINVDWKGSEQRYREVAKTDGHTVLSRIEEAAASGVHLEISVPVYHDGDPSDYTHFARWLSKIGKDVPVHLLKLFPAYRTNTVPMTSNKLILQVWEQMKEHLSYVYIGNLYGERYQKYRTTVCRQCNQTIATREALRTEFLDCGCQTIKTSFGR